MKADRPESVWLGLVGLLNSNLLLLLMHLAIGFSCLYWLDETALAE